MTATTTEIDDSSESGCEVSAMDATTSARPQKSLNDLVKYVREHAAKGELMADSEPVQEAVKAEELGLDYIGTTLHGYTEDTKGEKLFENDFQFLKDVIKTVNAPVIAEGNIQTPDMLARAFELGVHAVVVGGAITRPKQITERFASQIK